VGTRGTGCTCRCWRCTLTLLRPCRLDIVISSATSPFSYFPLSHTGNNIKDSAEWYENERECGRAILDFCIESGVSRADIFFTTKLKHNAGFDATINAINRSLELCGLDYINLYLIHGPWGGPDARRQAWEACVAAQKAGKVKSIGISTFGMRHMQELFDSGQPPPAVHQVCTIQSLFGIALLYNILSTDRLASIYDPDRNRKTLQGSWNCSRSTFLAIITRRLRP
jgi:hypothetical protein